MRDVSQKHSGTASKKGPMAKKDEDSSKVPKKFDMAEESDNGTV
jgi:hypothetical protein